MDSLPILASLDWPTAFAVVASVVTIVLGLFGYMIKSKPARTPPSVSSGKLVELENKHNNLVSQVDAVEDKVDRISVEHTQYKEQTNHKVDKLMDIIVKILSDDKL